jgi:hypothetical protein
VNGRLFRVRNTSQAWEKTPREQTIESGRRVKGEVATRLKMEPLDVDAGQAVLNKKTKTP